MIYIIIITLLSFTMTVVKLALAIVFRYGVTFDLLMGFACTILMLAISAYFTNLIRQARRRLLDLGWEVDQKTMFFQFQSIGLRNMKYIMRKEEFAMLPEFSSMRSDIENILACIESRRRHQRMEKVISDVESAMRDREETSRK
jgi:hypothetical protein